MKWLILFFITVALCVAYFRHSGSSTTEKPTESPVVKTETDPESDHQPRTQPPEGLQRPEEVIPPTAPVEGLNNVAPNPDPPPPTNTQPNFDTPQFEPPPPPPQVFPENDPFNNQNPPPAFEPPPPDMGNEEYIPPPPPPDSNDEF